jgi:hypothetical protein
MKNQGGGARKKLSIAVSLVVVLSVVVLIVLGHFIPIQKSSETDPSGCTGNEDRIYRYRIIKGERGNYEEAKRQGNFPKPVLLCGVNIDPLAHVSTHYYELYLW